MRVAVTGASGHLGNVVCRVLVEQGHAVRALVRADHRALNGVPVELVPGDVLDGESLRRLCADCEAVVHCAAVISTDGDPTGIVFRTNTQGPLNLWDAARACGVRRFVQVSSVHAVTELPHSDPYDESRPYKVDGTAYDRSKSAAEQALRERAQADAMELVVLRPSAILGPYDSKPSKMGAALLDFYNGKVPVLPPGGYDLVDVRDVARSVVAAITLGRPGEVYLLSGAYCTMKELAQCIVQVTGRRMPQRVLPFGLLRALLPVVRLWAWLTRSAPSFTREAIEALRSGHPRMDSSKAQRELAHRARPLLQTLRDFYNWQQQAGHIP